MSSAMGQSSFKFAAAKDWYDLPKELRELSTIFSFKTKIFKYFSELNQKQHVCTVKQHFSFLCISVFLYIIWLYSVLGYLDFTVNINVYVIRYFMFS